MTRLFRVSFMIAGIAYFTEISEEQVILIPDTDCPTL
jgi:hypothetical protein